MTGGGKREEHDMVPEQPERQRGAHGRGSHAPSAQRRGAKPQAAFQERRGRYAALAEPEPPLGDSAASASGRSGKHGIFGKSAAAPANPASDPTSNPRPDGKPPRKPGFIKRTVNGWWNRLLGAVSDGSLSEQDEIYAAHRTSRDYVWNTVGIGAWGMVFPILTIVVTQLVGAEQAGMFSLAFVTGMLLMIVANYGVRTYQVSDLDEKHSFSDYQINRWVTCALMVAVGVGYCMIRGYEQQMFLISLGVYLYKMVDGLADVYEGRLQQMDKLYLAGISQAFRSVVVLIVFSVCLLITRNLAISSIAMAIAAAGSFVVLTFPLALLETPKSRRVSLGSVIDLFKQCFPLFIALFLYALIDNMPKFVMEGVLSYDNQLYFNALYFPAQGILLTVGFIYKPLLVKMAAVWADPEKRKRFDLIIVVILAVVVALTLAMVFVMGWIGIPIMSFLYGLDFEQFRELSFIMLAAGGVTAAIDFLYQVITVLRQQKAVMKLYVLTFGFSLFVPILLVNFTGLPGAVIGYLIVMCILFVLLLGEYVSIRIALSRNPEAAVAAAGGADAKAVKAGSAVAAPSAAAAAADASAKPERTGRHAKDPGQRVRPSELRAERERREKVHEKWESRAAKRDAAASGADPDADNDEKHSPA